MEVDDDDEEEEEKNSCLFPAIRTYSLGPSFHY